MKSIVFCILISFPALAQVPYFRFEPEYPYSAKNPNFSSILYQSPAALSPEQQAVQQIGQFLAVKPEEYRLQVIMNQYLAQFDSVKIQKIKPLLLSETKKLGFPADTTINQVLDDVSKTPDSFLQPGEETEKLQAYLFDFDKDGKVDMWVMQDVMFGPSLGHWIWIRKNDKPEKIIQGSGGFITLKKQADGKTLLTYTFLIIDPSECRISTHFIFDPKTKKTEITKLYHSSKTVLPKLVQPFRTFTVTSPQIFVRFSPVGIAKLPDETESPFKGNVVAKFKKGAKGYVLATQKEWAFVAFLPDNALLIESNLHHGMDGIGANGSDEYLPNQVYLCGWVQTKNLFVK